MADFRAQPIPPGLLEKLIEAKSQDPLARAVKGITGGVERGLELTDKVDKIRQKRQITREISRIAASPEFGEFNEETKGLAGIAIKTDPAETLNIFRQMQEKKTDKRDFKPVYTELEAIETAGKTYGYSEEMKTRQQELGAVLKTQGEDPGEPFGWGRGLGEPLTIKMRRQQVELGRNKQDPEYDRLYKQVGVAKDKWTKSRTSLDEKNYDAAVETFRAYYNTKYPLNAIPTFEEAKKTFMGITYGTDIVPANLTEEEKEALKWARENPGDPDAKEIFKKLGVKK